jgi:Zn-dependent metalloprotease
MRRFSVPGIVLLIAAAIIAGLSFAGEQGSAQVIQKSRAQAIQQLKDSLSNRGQTKTNRATGLVDFVRLDRNSEGSLAVRGNSAREESAEFFRERGLTFGLENKGAELTIVKEDRDAQGGNHLTYQQIYQGVPVFAGIVKTHFDASGLLRVVNGEVVPDISLDSVPSFSADDAKAAAIAKVQTDKKTAADLTAKTAELYIFRTGFAQGVEGENHLTWRVVVTNGSDVLEYVFIDAHSGEFVDQITGVHNALDRYVYDGENLPVLLPPSFPNSPFWYEGQSFPTGNADADSIILTSKDTYDLFQDAFGRDSFDGAGSPMVSIFSSGPNAGNASALIGLTAYGAGFASDDVVAHEWTHNYTFFTDGLLGSWQPGSLNEGFSDIFGETVDLLNGHGLDSPGGRRQDDACLLDPNPRLNIISPASFQGAYKTGRAAFGPPIGTDGINGKVVLINDGVRNGTTTNASETDGCQAPFRNADKVRGNIALIDSVFFGCTWSQKVRNAQLSGAIAVIMANTPFEGETPTFLAEMRDPSITIPTISVGYSVGQKLRMPPPGGVQVNITAGDSQDSSYRWLMGEEVLSPSIRDMWCPAYNRNPGKTSDSSYWCFEVPLGGAHANSGIVTHAYALLVDGGTYNGQTIQALGFTKALHIYFRAMSVYQTPVTDFADHAEALEVAAADLIGVDLPSLSDGQPSGEIITPSDVEQVHKTTLAVELRDLPSQCGFTPVLAKYPPADACMGALDRNTIFGDDFEIDPLGRWTASVDANVPSEFIPREWTWVNDLPDERPGSGFFAIDPLSDCVSNQAGALHLDSPVIQLPSNIAGGPHVSFEHWVATRQYLAGGQLRVSVNGGPFQFVSPSAYIYNGYNSELLTEPGLEALLSPGAGLPAFSGTDLPTFKGSWGRSIVDLTSYAKPGDRIRLRWDMGSAICGGTNLGWYIDDVRVYACQPTRLK